MAFIQKAKASLGDAIMKGAITPTTSTAFDTTQNELWTGTITAVASQITSIGITCFTTNQALDFPRQPGAPIIFNQAWVTTQANTAVALVAQINAAALDVDSPLYGLVSAASTGGGGYTITTTDPSLVLQFDNLVRVTMVKNLSGFDLSTYQGNCIVVGTTTTAINYNELGVAATAGVGILVGAGAPFDIIGNANILNFRCIEASGASPATVNYEIYVG